MPKIIFNGLLKEKNEVHIPVDDRSFRYGDGCFETIPFYNHNCFRLSDHLTRLKSGLTVLKIHIDLSHIEEDIDALIKDSNIIDGFIRIHCSRGSGSVGFLPNSNCKPYYLIEILKRVSKPFDNITIFISDRPKISLQQLPVNAKLNNGLNSILARMEAEENGCFESVQLTIDGYISEGSSSNISWLKNDILYMPSEDCDILKGVTQTVLEEISPFKITKGKYKIEELLTADEIMLTNSSWEIVRVQHIHGNEWMPKTCLSSNLKSLFQSYVKNYSK